MRSKIVSILAFATVLIALLIPTGTLAGGWAVITLDQLPEDPVAGQPLVIGFTVLQHGRTPMADLTPTITLENQAGGDQIIVNAHPEGETGHYTAELVFPAEGTWDWSIQAFSMDQTMPPLAVSPDPRSRLSEPAGSSVALPQIAAAIALVSLACAFILLFRARYRWALALLIAGLVVGGIGFAFTVNQSSASVSPPDNNQSLAESGQRLFIAKGCTTCHTHDQIARDRRTIYVDAGPNLSYFSADPAYLRRWLADPASVKPGTEMPDLALEEAEIEALVVFLNSE